MEKKVAYVFPGQGSQYVGMGKDLYEQYPAAKAVFDAADDALGFPLTELCFEGPEEELKKTINAQPALLTMSIASLEAAQAQLGSKLPKADFAAGHSLGEYSALVATGAMDFKTAIVLTRIRGRLMNEAGEKQPGTMAAVIAASRETVEKCCAEAGVFIANVNCPGQIVISGEKEKIAEATKLLKASGAKYVLPLQVSGAFHSPLMASAVPILEDAISEATIQNPAIPVIGNTQTQLLCDAAAIRSELIAQLCGSVLWQDTVEYMLQLDVDSFIEFGPGTVLTGLVQRINREAKTINIGKTGEIDKLS